MKPKIEILADNAALAGRVAQRILDQARQAIVERGRFTLVLTGGKSPVPLYRLLAEDPAYREFPWQQTLCFFGDERPVPPDHPESNYRLARENLFQTGLVPQENIFRLRGELPDTAEAAAEYERKLRDLFPETERLGGFPRFDVILLGLGANGHTASLFPDSPGLENRTDWVISNWAPELQTHRLTMTFPVLNAAREVYLEAIDPKKQTVISKILAEEKGAHPFPVQAVSPIAGGYLWFLTKATAPSSL